MSKTWLQKVALVSMLAGAGCSSGSSGGGGGSSSSSSTSGGQSGSSSGGTSATGGSNSSSKGGSSAVGGSSSKGGSSADGGSSSSKATGGQGGGSGGKGGGTGTGTGGTGGGAGSSDTSETGGTTGAGGTTPGTGDNGGAGGTTGGGGTTSSTGPVTVQLSQTRQTIDGFGINNNWQPALTDAEADALFDPNKGIGLNILRIGMGKDGKLSNTGSTSDISKAKARGAKYVIGSTWSPPPEWKTNSSENDGGHLKPEYYEQWATRIATFAKDNGLYAMSPGNEPDFASCPSMGEPCTVSYPTTLYTAKEMVAFIKIVGPKLQAAGVKVLAPEASEWIHIWSNISATGSEPGKKNSSDPLKCGCFGNSAMATPTGTCASTCLEGNGYDYGHWLYKDKDAWAALDILGVHQYDTQVAEPWPTDVNGGKPDKAIWQTEMSGVKWWPEQGPSTDIKNGVAVAGWLHNALTVGELNAWVWWWYKAQSAETNEGLLLSNGTDTKRHYTFGNFSKFVRPGYVRVDVTGSVPKDVLISAYKGTEGYVAIVAINKGSAEAKFPIAIAGGSAVSCTPNVTSKDADLWAGAAVTVTDGTFAGSLGGTSVTTFVCK